MINKLISDNFGNIFGDLEKKILNPNVENISKVIITKSKKIKCETKFSEVDMFGKQNIEVTLLPKINRDLQSEDIIIQIFIMDELFKGLYLMRYDRNFIFLKNLK